MKSQEKIKKQDTCQEKSGKMGVLKKNQEIKKKKRQILLTQINKIPFFPKPSNGKN